MDENHSRAPPALPCNASLNTTDAAWAPDPRVLSDTAASAAPALARPPACPDSADPGAGGARGPA
eukprot:1114740-Heterocapsa_arctica.AAC.1